MSKPNRPNWGKWQRTRGSSSQRGYGAAWRRERKKAIQRDKGLCQTCYRADRLTPGNIVDHIKPKAEGGTDELANLEVICEPCHNAKTAHESQGGKAPAGCDANGYPVDPDHPWNK